MTWVRASLATISALLALTLPLAAQTDDRCPSPVAAIVSSQGSIEARPAPENLWNSISLNAILCPGDSIRVGPNSRAEIRLFETGAVLRIDQNTTLQMLGPTEPGRSLLDLLRGAIHFFTRVPQAMSIRTPFVSAGVEGTEFLLRVERERTLVSVFEGLVRLTNDRGNLLVAGGQSATALAGQAPQLRIVVRPRDAVQWAVYYQPVLTPSVDPALPETPQNTALQESLAALSQGDITRAFDILGEIPDTDRTESFYVHRAGVELAVGRVDEARSDLNRALALSPGNAEAYALRTIIAVAQNDPEQALANGQQAVAGSPRSSSALIALSYAQQANFQLEAARDTLLQAVETWPDDTLAWARLAELWLSLGYLDRALEAAETANSLGPALGRTQTVLGFSRLAQMKISDAQAAFERALTLESESSLARLGLGLAKIRQGNLNEGRSEIEIAVGLDPNNALLRSYLGKAYFEEKRDRLADEQLNLAKQLDPNDPTPYFYDAIRKQTVNRPVEALADLQRSIELNQNRAVYRSRLLLDQDLAARSASLGRIYSDLGFEQLALVEGWKSIVADPGDYSGHRFLADTYAALPRHSIARVSELLQSQLLQPINITPIQPQLAESNLFSLEGAGPSEPSFNEYGPLFARNRLALQANAIVGGNDLFGDDLVVAGVAGRFSFSVGQFHSETEGFRENNDLRQDIYSAFLQVQLSEKTGVQAELRSKDFERGDLLLRFDPENFAFNLRQRDRVNSLRLGLHHAFAPNSDVIANVQIQRADLDTLLVEELEFEVDEDGYLVEGQHLYRTPRLKLITGAGRTQIDRTDRFAIFFFLFHPRWRRQKSPTLTFTSIHRSIRLRMSPSRSGRPANFSVGELSIATSSIRRLV